MSAKSTRRQNICPDYWDLNLYIVLFAHLQFHIPSLYLWLNFELLEERKKPSHIFFCHFQGQNSFSKWHEIVVLFPLWSKELSQRCSGSNTGSYSGFPLTSPGNLSERTRLCLMRKLQVTGTWFKTVSNEKWGLTDLLIKNLMIMLHSRKSKFWFSNDVIENLSLPIHCLWYYLCCLLLKQLYLPGVLMTSSHPHLTFYPPITSSIWVLLPRSDVY